MTFFLHIPELEAGMSAAQKALGTVSETESDIQQAKLVAMLDEMLSFATENVNSMLHLMGFSSIEDLNSALQNYNSFNLSLQQLFPAFSEPQITEVLARTGIGNMGKEADYGLVISAFEDSIREMFPQYVEGEFLRSDMQGQLLNQLNNPSVQNTIAADIMARLFGGITLQATGIIDLTQGVANFSDIVTQLGNVINKSARLKGASGTSATRTLLPFFNKLLKPFFENVVKGNLDIFSSKESYQILENKLKNSQAAGFNRDILIDRIRRGGVTVSTKVKTNMTVNGDTLTVTTYLDQLQTNVDKSIFDLSNRGDKSIEVYVNEICEKNPQIKEQITNNIKKFYWNIITSYVPTSVSNPLNYDEYASIIDQMVSRESGNIGWFFSQGTTKAGGAGMFGEIAGMIYISLLCPKLKANARTIWAGGVTGDAKPPADIILGTALKQYGIQVKNYTSGSILSHDYALRIKNIVDDAAANNDNNKLDLMTIQATSELGITEDEIEAVQNVIIANTFNIPYKRIGNSFERVGNVPAFSGARSELDATFKQATRYMAVISVIMHRLQYAEEITRRVSATKEEQQLQNTLWLINGSMFVSSVQILNELKEYVLNEIDRFFNISTSVRIKGDKLPEGIEEGNMTIVEYYNYSAKGLGETALSKVSARIGTNYRMSAFHK